CYNALLSVNAPTTPTIFTLSLHDALPISHLSTGQYALSQPKVQWTDSHQPGPQKPHESSASATPCNRQALQTARKQNPQYQKQTDRKSTRLNSSHVSISYAVFCLKKKNKI